MLLSQSNDAIEFIKQNLSKGEKLYVYGFSLGGDEAINKLVPMLRKEGIKVELLITVDAAKGYLPIDNIIEDNVKENINFFQLLPDTHESKGQANQRTDGTWKGIFNIKVNNTIHDKIDEDTKKWVIPMLEEKIIKNNNNKTEKNNGE